MVADGHTRKVNDVLIEMGSAMVKQRVIELLQSGLTRDQVNVMLQDEIIPAFNMWLRERGGEPLQ